MESLTTILQQQDAKHKKIYKISRTSSCKGMYKGCNQSTAKTYKEHNQTPSKSKNLSPIQSA
eukprot:7608714-Ditylum_brightwellii.AAC.1